jgi:hypothetical protein
VTKPTYGGRAKADVNGDGRADLIVQYDSPDGIRHWQVRVSNGSSFLSNDDWTTTNTPYVSVVGLADDCRYPRRCAATARTRRVNVRRPARSGPMSELVRYHTAIIRADDGVIRNPHERHCRTCWRHIASFRPAKRPRRDVVSDASVVPDSFARKGLLPHPFRISSPRCSTTPTPSSLPLAPVECRSA